MPRGGEPFLALTTTDVQSGPPAVPSLRASFGWLSGIADPVRLEVLRRLHEVGRATAGELAGHCLASLPTVRRHLEAMVAVGLLDEHPGQSDGETSGRPATRYSLTAPVREGVGAVFSARL